MATNSPKVHVVLRRPRSVVSLLAMVKAIQTSVSADKVTFPAPNPTMAQFLVHITDLDTAETATHTRTKGTVEVRNAKLVIVVSDLGTLRAYVQQVADADPPNAASIAQAAGMTIRKTPTIAKNDLSAKPNTKIAGAVDVVARATARRESHEWEFSLDGGKTWASSSPTLQAKTTITGFSTGAIVYVRHRTVTKTGADLWSQPTSVVAH